MPGLQIEGLSAAEWLELPDDELDVFVFSGDPVVFNAGSAEVLAEFKIVGDRLTLNLAHIDGGGEGVLPTLAMLAMRIATHRGLSEIEWLVHATRCANPNPRLRPMLERRGFEVVELPRQGLVYRRLEFLGN